VADFGIALAAAKSDGGTRLTETGMSLGTPHYMAPEQAMGEKEITPKADIYALGCVLYEMLTAEPPFTGATAQAIIARVMTEEPRSLTLQRKTIPPHVEAAVERALQKLPADRFASAAQFSEALGRTDFVAATRSVAAGRAPAASGRWRTVALAASALAVMAAAFAAWAVLRPLPRPVTRQRILLWNHPVARDELAWGLAISPDGATLVFRDTVGGTRQLWSKERDRLEPTPLAGTTGASGPAFSPDGEWIAFAADGKLKKIPRLGGSAITIADSANTNPWAAIAWLDNGTIAYNDNRYSLLLVNQDGGPVRNLIRADSLARGVVAVAALPRGRGLLFISCNGGCAEAVLRVIDLRSGAAQVLADQVLRAWYTPGGQVVFIRTDGGVFAAPFDLAKLSFRTPPVPALDGVRAPDMVLGPSGTLVYVSGASAGQAMVEAVWVSRQGQAAPIEPGWTFAPTSQGGLALSPDGRRLAVSALAGSNGDIWVKELDRGPLTRLTFQGDNNRPEWTADGQTVMYVSQRSGVPPFISARRADGTGVETSLVRASTAILELTRTPDPTRLIVRMSPASRDIMLARVGSDSAMTPLAAAPGYNEDNPMLSPNGRWLAYTSNESGHDEVYVRPYPNAESGRWQVSVGGGTEPLWSHSGRELFFRDSDGDLVSAAVSPGATFAISTRHVLFAAGAFRSDESHRQYDVTPDDRRFVFLRSVGNPTDLGETKLIMVENWLAELSSAGRRRP
jgi:serine/threonine-protein kinase